TTYVAGSTTLNGLPVADVGGVMPFVGGQPINTPGDPAGQLNDGETATIIFRVTINNPVPAGVTQVSNQGTVSATNHPAVPTDDPTVGGSSDPTITPVTAAPLLAATKTASVVVDAAPIGPSPGDTLQYIITIVNSGNGAATS